MVLLYITKFKHWYSSIFTENKSEPINLIGINKLFNFTFFNLNSFF